MRSTLCTSACTHTHTHTHTHRERETLLSLVLFSCKVVSDSVTPWTGAHQAPLSMEFPRQEDWSGLPFPSPGDLPDPGIEPVSLGLVGIFFTTEPPEKPFDTLAVSGCFLYTQVFHV